MVRIIHTCTVALDECASKYLNFYMQTLQMGPNDPSCRTCRNCPTPRVAIDSVPAEGDERDTLLVEIVRMANNAGVDLVRPSLDVRHGVVM